MTTGFRQNRIEGLDGLRGVAALAVFAVHFGQNTGLDFYAGPFDLRRLLENGELGVSLFFSLSGFLLGMPYILALRGERAWPSTAEFYRRRTARILPLYYAALTALVLIFGTWRWPGGWIDIALHGAFLFNFAEFAIISLNKPFWTLAVELQFYVMLPFLFLLLKRGAAISLGRQLAWIIALAALAYGAHLAVTASFDRMITWPGHPMLVWIRPNGAVVSQSLLAHLPHFLIGIAAAALFVDRSSAGRRKTWIAEALFWISAAMVVADAATGLLDGLTVTGGRYGLPVIPLLIGVIIFATPDTRVAKRLLESFPLRRLGTISFGIYVLHLPCQFFIVWQMRRYGLDVQAWWAVFGAASLSVTIVLAALSYRYLENPVLRAIRRRE